jgi:hypothetical protein
LYKSGASRSTCFALRKSTKHFLRLSQKSFARLIKVLDAHIPISARAFSAPAQKAAVHEYEFSASEAEMRVAATHSL